MKSFYWIIDHRAPRYVPRSEPHVVQLPIGCITAVQALAALILGGVTIGTHSVITAALTLLTALAFRHWLWQLSRYVVRIPKTEGLADYDIKSALLKMQERYQRNPDVRPVIEPVLITAYDLARDLNVSAVQARSVAVGHLVADSAASKADPEVDNADLDELLGIIKIRRQMRSEGLL